MIIARGSRFMSTDKAFYYMVAAWICLTRRFDHVMLLGINSAMLLLPLRLAFWRRVNVVVRSGSVDYVLDKWGFLSKLYLKQAERLLRFADLVVAVAPNIQRHLTMRGIHAVVIPNGISEVSCARPIDRDLRHVVAVGRITAQKNYRLLIEAARLVRDRGVRISIIGGADLSGEEATLRALVRERGVDNVSFIGVMDRARVLDCRAGGDPAGRSGAPVGHRGKPRSRPSRRVLFRSGLIRRPCVANRSGAGDANRFCGRPPALRRLGRCDRELRASHEFAPIVCSTGDERRTR